ncbi:hypothetical protein HDU76_006128 [Blyttiomyces sp. JEL0837]|nr:hypothetical protein HDU76_006128 [Blyttiomyces sp. JEL0837]
MVTGTVFYSDVVGSIAFVIAVYLILPVTKAPFVKTLSYITLSMFDIMLSRFNVAFGSSFYFNTVAFCFGLVAVVAVWRGILVSGREEDEEEVMSSGYIDEKMSVEVEMRGQVNAGKG